MSAGLEVKSCSCSMWHIAHGRWHLGLQVETRDAAGTEAVCSGYRVQGIFMGGAHPYGTIRDGTQCEGVGGVHGEFGVHEACRGLSASQLSERGRDV